MKMNYTQEERNLAERIAEQIVKENLEMKFYREPKIIHIKGSNLEEAIQQLSECERRIYEPRELSRQIDEKRRELVHIKYVVEALKGNYYYWASTIDYLKNYVQRLKLKERQILAGIIDKLETEWERKMERTTTYGYPSFDF